ERYWKQKAPAHCRGFLNSIQPSCSAELFVGHHQVVGDHLCTAAFNVVTLQEVHQLTVLEKCHGRAARWVRQEMLARLGHRIAVNASEYRYQVIGFLVTFQAEFGTWTG